MKTAICRVCNGKGCIETQDVVVHIVAIDADGVRKLMREKGLPEIVEALKEAKPPMRDPVFKMR